MSRPNDEGHRANDAPENHENQRVHFANEEDDRKALIALQAKAALCDCRLHEFAGGGYAVSRWRYCKTVPTLQAVADLLRRIGGR